MLATKAETHQSGVLIDDFGQARLADPGLLCVLANGLSIRSGTVLYRWMAPELLRNPPVKATFASDVYSVTMTSLVFLFHIQLVNTLLLIIFLQEIFTAGDPFGDVPDALVFKVAMVENKRPDRPEDVEDELWSLWGEGWNRNAAMRSNMENYVERLTQLM